MKHPRLTRILFWFGVVLTASPVLGMILTTASVCSAMHHFGEGLKSGAEDPDEMVNFLQFVLNRLSGSFNWTVAGFGVGIFVGLPVLMVALRLRRIEEDRNKPTALRTSPDISQKESRGC